MNLPDKENNKLEKSTSQLDQEQAFQKRKDALIRQVLRKIKRTEKKIQKSKDLLADSNKWLSIQHEADLLKANLSKVRKGKDHIIVTDWETEKEVSIGLKKELSPNENLIDLYAKSKKLKKGIGNLNFLIAKGEKELAEGRSELEFIQNATPDALSNLEKTVQKRVPQKIESTPLPYKVFFSASGDQIWVGKNDASNDSMSFKHANGSDWWFHIQDYPGSHVVLKVKKNSEPEQESIQDALLLALYYSRAKKEEKGVVVITQCKYLKKTKGAKPGQVSLSKHKTAYVSFNKERWENIQKRKTLNEGIPVK